ncbi:MAG: hypothetical protein ACKO0Z_08360 [Betaproteobacteria bacterium]
MDDDLEPATTPKKVVSYATLSVASDFLRARGIEVPITDDDMLSAADLLPDPPSGDFVSEQMAGAQIWLAYWLVSKNHSGIANANLNLKLIGCKPVDLEY